MVIKINEIREKLSYYKHDLYGATRGEQGTDNAYYTDTFKIPWVKPPVIPSRTGGGGDLVDKPVHQIASTTLIATRKAKKETAKEKEATLLISGLLNDWVKKMRRQNPDPVLQFLKYVFIRGEAWLHPVHNPLWTVPPINKVGMPVLFTTPDPMNVFANPNEDEEGVPEDVFISYERMPWLIEQRYPHWSNPLKAGEDQQKKSATWLEYWEKGIRYFEADGQPVLKGDIQPNPYGFVPFVHKVSGFGSASDEGSPEELVVSRLRRHRDLIARYASSCSDIDSIIHMFANKDIDVQPVDDMHEIPDDFRKQYIRGYGNIHELPFGVVVTKSIEDLPGREVFEWNYAIKSELTGKTPAVMSGESLGGSGRLQDITRSTAMKDFHQQVLITEDGFASAFGQALKICDEWPRERLLPDGIKKDDINGNYEVFIELKDEDPVELSRRSSEGLMLYKNGVITLKTLLTKYQGFSDDAAEKEMAGLLVDDVTRNDPIIRTIMGQDLAQEIGIEDRYTELQQLQGIAKAGMNPVVNYESRGGEPRMQNMESPQGVEMADLTGARPARRSPGG